jgi:hypothetical protein
MTDPQISAGMACPICTRGRLIRIDTNAWHCSRDVCNTEAFIDNEGLWNVRDKPDGPTPRERMLTMMTTRAFWFGFFTGIAVSNIIWTLAR